MKLAYRQFVIAAVLLVLTTATVFAQADPLPSWNEGKSKNSIMDFVAKVTKPGSPDSVPEPERIATFDNDGTLWSEQPLYFQLHFGTTRSKHSLLSTRNGRTRSLTSLCLRGILKPHLRAERNRWLRS